VKGNPHSGTEKGTAGITGDSFTGGRTCLPRKSASGEATVWRDPLGMKRGEMLCIKTFITVRRDLGLKKNSKEDYLSSSLLI